MKTTSNPAREFSGFALNNKNIEQIIHEIIDEINQELTRENMITYKISEIENRNFYFVLN